jgi:hypothetical protein
MSTNETFTGYLGGDFQMKLFWQILTEFEFGNKIFPFLDVSYFDNSVHKQFFILLKNYFDDTERVPNLANKSINEIIQLAESSFDSVTKELIESLVKKISDWNKMSLNGQIPYDGDIIQKHSFQFIKQQEYKKTAAFILDNTKNGNIRDNNYVITEVEEKIKNIYEIGAEDDDGVEVFHDIESALAEDYRECVPTGIKKLDELMGGGLGRGEIGLILAASGVGKTTVLTKISNSAANIGKKVLQIIFEDKPRDIQRKHFTIWSKIKLSELNNNVENVKEAVFKNQEKINELGGLLTIKKFDQDKTNIIDVKNWVERTQKKMGFKYDIITLDYIDCLEPHKKNVDLHQSELAIIKTFEALAGEWNIPLWSALQGNRDSFTSEFLTANNMGGNIKRAQKTHFLMSVAKTLDQKEAGLANISILKARFATDGQQFKDAIYNNNTMEITLFDTPSNSKKTKIPSTSKDDLERQSNNLKLHTKLSEVEKNNEKEQLNELKNLRLAEKKENNTEEKNKEPEIINHAEGLEKPQNETFEKFDNKKDEIVEEKDVKNIEFVKKKNIIPYQNNNDVNNFLSKARDNQGDIIKKEKS